MAMRRSHKASEVGSIPAITTKILSYMEIMMGEKSESPTKFMLRAGLGDATDSDKLLTLLLNQYWHKDCEIIDGYMPPFPGKDTRPTCVIRYAPFNCFLRHSRGPRQCFFWDIYGDDMQSVEVAVIALAGAPAPVGCSPITFTIPYKSDKV